MRLSGHWCTTDLMIRPSEFIHVLENPDAPSIQISDAGGALILRMLVYMFFADGELADKELALIQRLVGEDDESLRANITELNKIPMDWNKLAATYPDEKDRHDIITLAEHAYWGDDRVEPGEMDVLDKLAEVFGIDKH